jgi:hypothetical protein
MYIGEGGFGDHIENEIRRERYRATTRSVSYKEKKERKDGSSNMNGVVHLYNIVFLTYFVLFFLSPPSLRIFYVDFDDMKART